MPWGSGSVRLTAGTLQCVAGPPLPQIQLLLFSKRQEGAVQNDKPTGGLTVGCHLDHTQVLMPFFDPPEVTNTSVQAPQHVSQNTAISASTRL